MWDVASKQQEAFLVRGSVPRMAPDTPEVLTEHLLKGMNEWTRLVGGPDLIGAVKGTQEGPETPVLGRLPWLVRRPWGCGLGGET